MTSEILHKTFHILKKEQYSSIAEYDPNPNLVTDGADEGYQQLIDDICKRYSGRGGKGYGYFEEDTDNYPMSTIMQNYFVDKSQSFYDISKRMMNVLVKESSQETGATGGDVVITHYRDNGREYLLVAIVTEKTGSNRSGWSIKKTTFFDINNLRFAGRIDLTGWQNGDERYISFLKGTKSVSVYFKKFLGCNDELLASKETTKLTKAILNFAQEQNLSGETRDQFIEKVHNHLKEISDKEEEFILEVFVNAIWPEDPEVLETYLSSDEIKLSNGFIPDKRSLKSLTNFAGQTKTWRISFNRQAINDGDITYNKGEILIKNIPKELQASLEREIASDVDDE